MVVLRDLNAHLCVILGVEIRLHTVLRCSKFSKLKFPACKEIRLKNCCYVFCCFFFVVFFSDFGTNDVIFSMISVL